MAWHYYPFGMVMPGRSYTSGTGYRYGFNGKENDNEVKGNGNQQDYGMRVYDTRIARFLSVDPIASQFPFYSPYAFAGNKPIQAIDLDGKEEFLVTDYKDVNGNLWKTEITIVSAAGIDFNKQIVHRSEVNALPDGTYKVDYLYSSIGKSDGSENAFASDREREFVLGKENNCNSPLLIPMRPGIVNVNFQGNQNANAVANYYSESPALNNSNGSDNSATFVRSYYDEDQNYLGNENNNSSKSYRKTITNVIDPTPNKYVGTQPANYIGNNPTTNAVDPNPQNRKLKDGTVPPKGVGSDKLKNAQGKSGRNVPSL